MIKQDALFQSSDVTSSERCLHTPSGFAKQNLFYVQETGKLVSLKPHRCIREKLDSYLVMLVLNGKGKLTIEGNEYTLEMGDVAFIDCMKHYEHISSEEDAWKLAWVHFNGQHAKNYYELFLKYGKNMPVHHVEDIAEWEDLVDKLLTIQNDRSILAELKSSEIIAAMVHLLIERVYDKELVLSDVEKTISNEIREYLNEHYAEQNIVEVIEEKYSKQLSEINAMFHAHYGITVEEYVSNRRFLAAKELLRFSIKSVTDVAKESGIGDIIVMQQMFYDKENMTADEYRSRWAQWIR